MGVSAITGSFATPFVPLAYTAEFTPLTLGVDGGDPCIFPIAPSALGASHVFKQLEAPLATVQRLQLNGYYYRAVSHEHLARPNPVPLFFLSSLKGGRYTPAYWGPPALYLAQDQVTPLAEVQAITFDELGRPVNRPGSGSWVTAEAQVDLKRVLDLTDSTVCNHLGIDPAMLKAEWRSMQTAALLTGAPLPFTQCLGYAVHQSKLFDGILVHSARMPYDRECLVVFPDRLADGARVQVASPKLSQTLP